MAVGPVGRFDYRFTLSGTAQGLAGTALPSSGDRHPGIVGEQPTVKLRGSVITLMRTPDDRAAGPQRYARWGDFGHPRSSVSLSVGRLLSRVALAGDILQLTRGGTGDVGLTLTRGGELIAGLGAVHGTLPGIKTEDDPRANTMDLSVRSALADPRTRWVWLNADDAGVDEQIAQIAQLPGDRLVMAVGGKSAEQRHRVFGKIARMVMPERRSAHYVNVDERFENADQWLAYLKGLPTRRPSDLHVRFALNEGSVEVLEGDVAFVAPWHLFVNRVFTPGIPSALSMVAVVREQPDIDSDMVKDATIHVSSGLFDVTK